MPARIPEDQLIALSGFPDGVNNVAREDSLPPGALRAAVNVDLIGTDGKVRRRPGYARFLSGTRVHSLYAHPSFGWLLYMDGGTLYATDRTTTEAIRSGLAPSTDLSYTYANGCVWWSNGLVTGRIDEALNDLPWGVEQPKGQPLLAAVDGGALRSGQYQVAVTFIDTSGEESGSTLASVVEAGTNQAITLSSIPQPEAANVMAVRVYVSPCDGDVLYRLRDLPVGLLSTTITHVEGLGRATLATQFLAPMPAGTHVAAFNGRLYSATGRYVWFSEPLRYGQCRESDGFMRFPGNTTMLAPVSQGANAAGIYVSAGTQTFFVSGADPTAAQRLVAYPRPAVPGTLCYVPGSAIAPSLGLGRDEVPVWMADNGVFVLGAPGGSAIPLTENRLALQRYERGAALFRDWKGARQVIISTRGAGGRDTLSAGDYAVATITRNGITLP